MCVVLMTFPINCVQYFWTLSMSMCVSFMTLSMCVQFMTLSIATYSSKWIFGTHSWDTFVYYSRPFTSPICTFRCADSDALRQYAVITLVPPIIEQNWCVWMLYMHIACIIIYMYVYVYVYVHMYICIWAYVYIYIYVCIYIYMYIYMYV